MLYSQCIFTFYEPDVNTHTHTHTGSVVGTVTTFKARCGLQSLLQQEIFLSSPSSGTVALCSKHLKMICRGLDSKEGRTGLKAGSSFPQACWPLADSPHLRGGDGRSVLFEGLCLHKRMALSQRTDCKGNKWSCKRLHTRTHTRMHVL